jgi:hypothetical protein
LVFLLFGGGLAWLLVGALVCGCRPHGFVLWFGLAPTILGLLRDCASACIAASGRRALWRGFWFKGLAFCFPVGEENIDEDRLTGRDFLFHDRHK